MNTGIVAEERTSGCAAEEEAILDWTALVENWDGDHEFAEELLTTFIEHFPAQRAALVAAVSDADAKELNMAAHTLKGSLLAIMANSAADSAFTLETMGRNNDLTNAADAWQRLDRQLDRLVAEIEKILNRPA